IQGYAMTLCKFRWVKIYLSVFLLHDFPGIVQMLDSFPDSDSHNGQVPVIKFGRHHLIPDETGYGFDKRSVVVHAFGKRIDGVLWHMEPVDEVHIRIRTPGVNQRILRQHANLLEETESVCLNLRSYNFTIDQYVRWPAGVREVFDRTGNILKRVVVCSRQRVPDHDGISFSDDRLHFTTGVRECRKDAFDGFPEGLCALPPLN